VFAARKDLAGSIWSEIFLRLKSCRKKELVDEIFLLLKSCRKKELVDEIFLPLKIWQEEGR